MGDLYVLAVGLAMDATAVAAGLGARERSFRPVLVGAVLFGLFQAGMSGLGWLGGMPLARWAGAVDHWIAFGLLTAIGLHMIREALSHDEGEPKRAGTMVLLGLAVATSIDALAAGVTLPMIGTPGLPSIGVIGGVTLVLSLVGGALGRRLGERIGTPLEILGGLVLVAIGLKVLLEHLLGS